MPPGLALPDGTLVGPGTILPPTFDPGDPVPPGIVIVPGTTFPSDWTPEDIAPEGVTLDPGAEFPPGWNPPDPVPEGLYPAPVLPPAAVATGPTPPTYVAPGTPGPVHPPSPSPPAVCPVPAFDERFTTVTPGRISTDLTHVAFDADLDGWFAYLIGALSGTCHLQIIAGRLEPYMSSSTGRTIYFYIKDSPVFNIRCATTIRAQSKRSGGGGQCELRLYDAQPPGGNVIMSVVMRTTGSYGYVYLPMDVDITGYSNLHLCVWTYDGRWQAVTTIQAYT